MLQSTTVKNIKHEAVAEDLSLLNEAKVVLLAQERNPTHSNYSHTAGGVMDFFFFFVGKKKNTSSVFSLPRF